MGDLGLPIPDSARSDQATAVAFIIDQMNKAPGEVVLCPIGLMTNIVVALLLDPSIARKVHSIVFMGGAAFCPGNVTANTEFNFLVDPHVAQIVMQCGALLAMFGLDVIHQGKIESHHIATLQVSSSICAQLSARLLSAYAICDLHLYDPCVIAWLLKPQPFSGVQAQIEVVTQEGPEFGRSEAAVASSGNCFVIKHVDAPSLFELLLAQLARLP